MKMYPTTTYRFFLKKSIAPKSVSLAVQIRRFPIQRQLSWSFCGYRRKEPTRNDQPDDNNSVRFLFLYKRFIV